MTFPIVTLSTFIFFFSSRRRHTRSKRDWSSDVCSSDLLSSSLCIRRSLTDRSLTARLTLTAPSSRRNRRISPAILRSEERRVGKECRSRWSQNHERKKRDEDKKIEAGKKETTLRE